jgi:AcrR family transcriptional regulator
MPTSTFYNLSKDKQARIFQAAAGEFAQRNVESAKLSNIVKAAKIPRGSIYQYFNGKDDIYIYVVESLREKRAEYVKPAFDLYKKEPFLTFFEAFYIRDSSFFSLQPLQLEIGKHMYGHAHGVSRKLIELYKSRYRDIFLLGIDYDMERGVIRPDVNGAVLADLCVHLVTEIIISQNLNSSLTRDSIREQASSIISILRSGVES